MNRRGFFKGVTALAITPLSPKAIAAIPAIEKVAAPIAAQEADVPDVVIMCFSCSVVSTWSGSVQWAGGKMEAE